MTYNPYRSSPPPGWLSMESALRDGTPIEVQCNYGIAPWFGIYRWTNKRKFADQDGNISEYDCDPCWVQVGNDSSGFVEDSSFSWRPYFGASENYIDPTNGAQDTEDYWLKAVGMPTPIHLSFAEELQYRPPRRNFWDWFRRIIRKGKGGPDE